MKPDILPKELSGKPLYDFLVKNEQLIFHAKKSEKKKADGFWNQPMFIDNKGSLVSKDQMIETQIDPTKIKAVVIINTTNWYDSHGDVHIPGLWKKSLADNSRTGFYLLKIHGRDFEDVIADECKGDAKKMTWKSLNIELPGVTEALVFEGVIEKERNPYMFDQYQKGYVKQHSVGMRYVKLLTCINDEDYPVQKENWDKYFPMVANAADAEKEGYFWAILEAQIIEGSAVLFGSNCMTPTQSIEPIDTEEAAAKGTAEEQPLQVENIVEAFKGIKLFN